jgi:hypothetical protein
MSSQLTELQPEASATEDVYGESGINPPILPRFSVK